MSDRKVRGHPESYESIVENLLDLSFANAKPINSMGNKISQMIKYFD